MIVALRTERLETLEQVRGFVEGDAGMGFAFDGLGGRLPSVLETFSGERIP